MKAILICLNTKCGATLADKTWIIDLLSNVQIRKMQTSLRVKDIESFTHKFIEYVCISVYFSGFTKNDFSALTFIAREIHLINDLKAKMLIENDLLSSKDFIIDIEKKSTTIDSCEINIALEIQFKDSFVRKNIHVQHVITLQSNEEQLLIIDANISEERDFFFEFDRSANFIMYAHILDVNTRKILIMNETKHIIKVSRRHRLNHVSKINCDNCFQISETNLAIRFSKKRKSIFAHATINNSSFISSIDLADKKVRLFNESMIYDNDETRTAFANFIAEFLSLWDDRDFIDVSQDKWMRISLKSDWQTKINEKAKIYSFDIKNKAVLNKTFDELHMKSRIKWANKATSFSYSMFVTWKIVNDIRKERTVIDIRDFNDLIVLDAYSISSQSNIINELRNCTNISIFDASSFFYQWRMHLDDIYKLIVVTHRGQKIFLISVMRYRNSMTYVQRQMNIILRQFQSFAKIYIDDIVMRSRFLDEHISHLRQFFKLFV